MVRREEDDLKPKGEGTTSCCASPAGESPVRVSARAPGSRLREGGEIPLAQAERQKPLRREQQRGPQHKVKPAASTEKQWESRAAHVTAKAKLDTVHSGRWLVASLPGVRGAARVEGEERNTGGPSARPQSGRGEPYKLKVKAATVQRESEGIVVPQKEARASGTNAVKNNAAGGKGPWSGYVVKAGKREGMAGRTGPNDPDGLRPFEKAQELPRRLWAAAKQVTGRTLYELADHWRGVTSSQRRREFNLGACVKPRPERPLVSRVREIRMHGLRGGSTFSRAGYQPLERR